MSMDNARSSNIELLRLLSMLMVLNVHTFFPPEYVSNSVIDYTSYRLYLDFLRESTSISCVNLFVLISGYFSIKWKIKSISSLIFQVYFWVFIVYIVSSVIGITEFSIHHSLKHLFLGVLNEYWFIPTYIGLYLLSPLLNSFVDSSNIKQLKWFIIIYYVFFTLDAIPYAKHFSSNGYSIFSFCGLYLLGRYINLSNIKNVTVFNTKTKLFVLILITTLLIFILSLFSLKVLHKGGLNLLTFPLSPFSYNNPVVIIQSILIFLFFLKINFRSNFINYCAGSALAIYLLHMHTDLKEYYYGFSKMLYTESLLTQYLFLLLLFIAVLLIAIPMDKVRIMIFNKLYSGISYYLMPKNK